MSVAVIICFFSIQAWSGNSVADWEKLEKDVRYGRLSKPEARKLLRRFNSRLIENYAKIVITGKPHFPLRGYGPSSIGGDHGEGFRPKGYDFYDGNRHGGHPAHDIFIHDKDQDTIDDKTGKPVDVVAFLGGVVVSTNNVWTYPDDNRSGIYAWVFVPELELYCQYVHLASVSVKTGDIVKAGDIIGTVGRTGKNAYPKRSPTHLHFMCLKYSNGGMVPYNTYRMLLTATRT